MRFDDVSRRGSRRRLIPDEGGTTAVEFAIIAPAFVALLLCIVEFGWQLTIDTALNVGCVAGARFGSTGNNAGGSQAAAIVGAVVAASGGLIRSSQLTISDQSYASAAAYTGGASPSTGAGSSAQFVLYTLTYKQAFFTGVPAKLLGLSSITHQATVAVQNEPY